MIHPGGMEAKVTQSEAAYATTCIRSTGTASPPVTRETKGLEMEWDFGDVFLTMTVFFIWMVFIVMFIATFIDVLRRHDISGWSKVGWTLLILVFPVLGIFGYMLARPKILPADVYGSSYGEYSNEAEGYGRAPTRYSSADEIAKLADLHSRGAITDEEFEELKKKVA